MSNYSKETSTHHKHKLLSDLITSRIISGHIDTNRDGTITTATTSATTTTTISCGTLITMLNNFARIIRDVKPRYVSLAYTYCHQLCSKLSDNLIITIAIIIITIIIIIIIIIIVYKSSSQSR